MSAPRLVSVALLLLAACAGWEASSPSYTPPTADAPSPSHYAPPTPGDPREPNVMPDPSRSGNVRAAIASVQLLQDCPDPKLAAPAAASSAASAASLSTRPMPPSEVAAGPMLKQSGDTPDGVPWTPPCDQSMAQISVRSDFAGKFRIDAVRVLDAGSKKVAGTAVLRGPMLWSDTNGTYTPWDERTVAGTELKVSYKLGDPDLSRAEPLIGPNFNTFTGPFMLELDVSVDGVHRIIRSAEFTREPPHVIVT